MCELLTALRRINVLALDLEQRERPLGALVEADLLEAGLDRARAGEVQRLRCAKEEDVVGGDVGGGRDLAVPGEPRQQLPGVADASGRWPPSLGEREVGQADARDAARIAVEIDLLDSNAADEREGRRNLQPVLECGVDVADVGGLQARIEGVEEAAHRIDERHFRVGRREICHAGTIEIQAAGTDREHGAIVHAGDMGIPGEIGHVAELALIVRDVEVGHAGLGRSGIERVVLRVLPLAVGVVEIDLAPAAPGWARSSIRSRRAARAPRPD